MQANVVQTPTTSGTAPAAARVYRRWGRSRPKSKTQRQNALWKVHVSGYPHFTQPHDLTRAISKYGAVTVCSFTNQYAVIGFPSEEIAACVIRMANSIYVYGEAVNVKWFVESPGNENQKAQPQHQKRDFTRSKQKGVIVAPKDIDLSGDFHTQLDQVLGTVRLTLEEVTSLSQLYSDVESALQELWPGCTAMPFGSITTGLGIKTSDADCFVLIPDNQWNPHHNHVNKAKKILQLHPGTFAEILSIPRANTPIVKFFHIPTETNCDLTFKTPLGAQNSKLIAFMLHLDPRLIPMAVLIKYWAKVHELSGTGKLTNYALTMLIIFYLQQQPISILPSVQSLQQDRNNDYIVDDWNTGFKSDRHGEPFSTNTSSICELLGGFFEYYSNFDFDNLVVCPYLGKPIKKDVFKDHSLLPEGFERYKKNVEQKIVYPIRNTTPMCVQDPFEQCHNVASAISYNLASDIKAYIKFAANAYENDKLNNCEKFLKIILLEAPKIVRSKHNPEYRVSLFPRILNDLKDPDWKTLVRGIIITIFEKMLKLNLELVTNKENQEPKQESRKIKERYTGTATSAIWKRKQFTKLYNGTNLSFEEKQEKITEEVLRVEKQEYKIQYTVTVTFCNDPKSVVVLIKIADGEQNGGREFGKFFLSVMQNWVISMLKPHLKGKTDSKTTVKDAITTIDSNLKESVAEDVNNDRNREREISNVATTNGVSDGSSSS